MNMPQRSASFSGSESPSAPVSPFSQPVSPTAESSIRPVSSQTIDLDLNGSRDVDRSKSQTATPDPSWGGYPTAKGVSPSRPPRPRTNSGGRVAAASYGSASPSKDSQDLRRALHRSSSSPATPMLSSQSLKDIERLMGPEVRTCLAWALEDWWRGEDKRWTSESWVCCPGCPDATRQEPAGCMASGIRTSW